MSKIGKNARNCEEILIKNEEVYLMKKKLKGKWIVLASTVGALFLAGGCTVGRSLDETLGLYDLTAQVTYYSNGGLFEGTSDVKQMYFKSGSKALDIGNVNPTNGSVEIERDNYEFGGWYHAVLDGSGEPVFLDEDEKLYELGDQVDFTTPLEKGDHWVLVARWIAMTKVNVQLVCDEGEEVSVTTKDVTKKYENGSIMGSLEFDVRDEAVQPDDDYFKIQDNAFTLLDYYTDKECTKAVKWPIDKADEDVTIYAKYLKGDWEIVKTVNEATKMLNNLGAGKHYWLYKDIDLTGKSISPKTFTGAEIQGNGFKLSNLTVTRGFIEANSKVSLFGDIEAGAKIENLTMDGLTIEYSIKTSPVDIYFAFSSLSKEATLTNVVLSGTMTVTKSKDHTVSSFDNDYANCLYGGYTTDADYITESEGKGVTVEGKPSAFITVKNL